MPFFLQVFELDAAGDPTSFTFNNHDRCPTILPPEAVPQVYLALQRLMQVIADPTLSVWLQLQPGTTIFIHNTRVLYGRSAFHAAVGRQLDGCYLNNEEFRSTLRVLARKYDRA